MYSDRQMEFILPEAIVEPNFTRREVKFLCMQAETLEGVNAVWQYLDSYRNNLIEKSAKFESDKKLFESHREKALEHIHLDLQSQFQCKIEDFIRKLNEATHLLTARKQKIDKQSKYITELEDKLKSSQYNVTLPAVTVQEKALNNQTLFELERENSSLKSAIEFSKKDFEERRFLDNRITELEINVNQLTEERDQLQEMVQQLSKEKQESIIDNIFECKTCDAFVSAEQLDQEETTQLVNLSSESSSCHSVVASIGCDVEDVAVLSELHLLNAEESRNIWLIFHTSTSQHFVASSIYLKLINSSWRSEHTQSLQALTELLEACDTNIQYLQSIQSRLKTSDSSTDDNVVTSVKQLLKKWVQLNVKVYLFQRNVEKQGPTCPEQSATFPK
ncbi:hypothetical protein DAPPUDRAFT_313656 [Daphnia pulex]|uniref:Uncharacterized protein n=1 Tax=Daphnia pulex TaxID=6669 RepID=E9G3R8_DAPPU|nr:hypothetical protein DAPPUDRAFT_313656 [Daphnia pulex]|eukprot:EFX85814.1 hypothetical protein DAPPUDRAFT_313656 [Daphnia pulex]